MEHRIGREGACDPISFPKGSADCRLKDLLFFVAEAPVFSGVGIQAGHSQEGMGDPETLPEAFGGQQEGAEDSFRREESGDFPERFMDGDQGDFQPPSGHHHNKIGGAGAFGEEFRVTGIGKPGHAESAFVERTGHQGIGFPILYHVHGFRDVSDGCGGRGPEGMPPADLFRGEAA